MNEQETPGQAEDDLTPPVALTPEIVADIRRRAERRARKGWEYSTVPVEALYALCDAADELARERRRTAALEEEAERLRPVLDAALLLSVTPSRHPAYEDRKSDSWALAFEEARKRGLLADAPGRPGGEGEGE